MQSEDDSDSEDRTTEEHIQFYESYLSDEGINVVDLAFEEPRVELTYRTDRQGEEELADEIGVIAGGYMITLEEGWETDRLESVMVLAETDQEIATWYMEATWYEEFQSEERTAEELSGVILSTVESLEE